LAINFIIPSVQSIRIHSSIDIVVLFGTALDTICRPLTKLDLEQMNFMKN